MVTRTSCVVCQKAGTDMTYHRFPANKKLKKIWISRVPRKDWKWSPSSRLCSAHFIPSDYKKGTTDTNKRRMKVSIKKRLLNSFALPSVWPCSSAHTIKQVAKPRPTTMAEAEQRAEIDAANDLANDTIIDLETLKQTPINMPHGVQMILEVSVVSFIKICTADKPRIEYCLLIRESLS